MNLEATATPRGGVRIDLDGKSQELAAAVAMAFVSNMLAKMQQATPEDASPEGGAVFYPDQVFIEKNLANNGEPRLNFRFGKALMVVDLPTGLLKQIGRDLQAV